MKVESLQLAILCLAKDDFRRGLGTGGFMLI
jgi:hypothetical protein